MCFFAISNHFYNEHIIICLQNNNVLLVSLEMLKMKCFHFDRSSQPEAGETGHLDATAALRLILSVRMSLCPLDYVRVGEFLSTNGGYY